MATITGQVLAALRRAPLTPLAGFHPPPEPGWYVLWKMPITGGEGNVGNAGNPSDPEPTVPAVPAVPAVPDVAPHPPFYVGEARDLAAQMERLRLLLHAAAGILPAEVSVQYLAAAPFLGDQAGSRRHRVAIAAVLVAKLRPTVEAPA
jgi:hypothetical protein